jgi:hypothetical protein
MTGAILERRKTDQSGSSIIPGYKPYGRATAGDLVHIEDRLDQAKTIPQVKKVLKSIHQLDIQDDHLDLIEQLGREWGDKIANSRITKPSDWHTESLRHEYGLKKLRQLYHQVLKFDLQNGTRTSGYIPIQFYKTQAKKSPDLFANTANISKGVRHRASSTAILGTGFNIAAQILQENNIPQQDVSFYDFGCGSGKPSLYARMYHDFQNVVGIDYFQPLLDIGEINKKVLGYSDTNNHNQKRIAFKFADAVTFDEFKAPANGALIAYAYNPFGKEIMSAVASNIEQSGISAIFLYNKPLHEEVFKEENGWLKYLELNSHDDDNTLGVFTRGLG